ncbi:MAG: hypothetical protein HY568_00350, partial [Candidatus Latescibacteria bacterium]|nr:hypothetical protein [Candidatus Latescibacterota bacterium]
DQPRAGTHDVAVGAISSMEDEIRTINRLTSLRGTWRPGPAWTIVATIPYVNRTHEHFANESGSLELLRWSYRGLGDAEVQISRSVLGGPASRGELRVHWGAKVPTGRRNVPEVNGEQPEPPARPGTGSWDAILGATATYGVHIPNPAGGDRATPVRAMIIGRWNGKGTEEYRVGRELQAHLAADYPLSRVFAVMLQGNMRVREKDDVGLTDSERENSGGTWAYFTPGLRASVADDLSFYALVQVPVYQRVNRIQLVSDYNLSLGVTRGVF